MSRRSAYWKLKSLLLLIVGKRVLRNLKSPIGSSSITHLRRSSMAGKLKNNPQIRKFANDLGLRGVADPVAAILDLCRRKVRDFRCGFTCETLSELLMVVASKV